MSDLQKKIYKLVEVFFRENADNKMNRWLLTSLLNEMNELFRQDEELKKNAKSVRKEEDIKNVS